MPPQNSVICSGCNTRFSQGGYLRHLRKTTKPACIAQRLETEQYRSDSDCDSPPLSSPPLSPGSHHDACHLDLDADDDDDDINNNNLQAGPFQGDCLGVYEDSYWDDYDEYEGQADEGWDGEDVDGNHAGGEGRLGPEDDEEEEVYNYGEPWGWEPQQRPPSPDDIHRVDDSDVENLPPELRHVAPDRESHQQAKQHLHARTHVVHFPGGLAGSPITSDSTRAASGYHEYQTQLDSGGTNPYTPFTSRIDWEVAQWAKLRGPGSTALTDLLKIEDVSHRLHAYCDATHTHHLLGFQLVSLLGLSFKTSAELNAIIDEKLTSGRPRFIRREIVVAGEAFEVFYRDVIECVRALYGDPEFAGLLVFTPERHYADRDHTVRVYFDMHTGEWWWSTQVRVITANQCDVLDADMKYS